MPEAYSRRLLFFLRYSNIISDVALQGFRRLGITRELGMGSTGFIANRFKRPSSRRCVRA